MPDAGKYKQVKFQRNFFIIGIIIIVIIIVPEIIVIFAIDMRRDYSVGLTNTLKLNGGIWIIRILVRMCT